MNTRSPIFMIAAALALSAVMFKSGTAFAVTLRTSMVQPVQIGTGAQIRLGHTVLATTNYNRLYAGGTYEAACAASETTPTGGQRFFTSAGTIGGTSATVTIPAVLPGRVNMPGFNASTLRGRRLDCTYNWTSRAVESHFTISAGGVGFTMGGGEMNEGSTELFSMTVPSGTDPNNGSTCTP